jgi:hypothetical protein
MLRTNDQVDTVSWTAPQLLFNWWREKSEQSRHLLQIALCEILRSSRPTSFGPNTTDALPDGARDQEHIAVKELPPGKTA